MAVHAFDPPERFVAGTVGPPGQRTFFLQARGGGHLTSVSLEKAQLSILADRVNDLLDTVAGGGASETMAAALADNDPLEAPIDDEFRVVALSLAWDESRQVVVIEAHDHDPDEESPGEQELAVHSVRVVLPPLAARVFARRSLALIASGRPACPFCGQPIDPEGHICPRANGYRR